MRLITLNGVKLLVYRNGMILRYSEIANGKHLKKGWNLVKGFENDGCMKMGIKSKPYLCHRIIAFAFLGYDIEKSKLVIDHIDRNRLNNNLNNLRIVSVQENAFNTKAKGYSWHKKAQKYKSHIKINGKCLHLGYFDTEEEAHQAYLEAKTKYHIIPNTLN